MFSGLPLPRLMPTGETIEVMPTQASLSKKAWILEEILYEVEEGRPVLDYIPTSSQFYKAKERIFNKRLVVWEGAAYDEITHPWLPHHPQLLLWRGWPYCFSSPVHSICVLRVRWCLKSDTVTTYISFYVHFGSADRFGVGVPFLICWCITKRGLVLHLALASVPQTCRAP